MTRILLVTHYYPQHRSGIELVAAQLASRLVRRGIEITWAASGPLQEPLPDGIRSLPMHAWNGIERTTGFAYPIWSPHDLARLRSAVARHDVVHLHEHLYSGNIAAAFAARRENRSVLVTQHTSQIWPSPAMPFGLQLVRTGLAISNRTIGRRILANADQCIFISARAREYFESIARFRRPPLYVPNGIDFNVFSQLDAAQRQTLRAELGWPPDRPCLLFVGRLIAKKGVLFLRELAARIPECNWYLAGKGPIDPATWKLKNVHTLGESTQLQLARYYQAADLLVLPSLTEGFPLVVQEAMACGTPALVSRDTALGSPDAMPHLIIADITVAAMELKLREVLPSLAQRRETVAQFARANWNWDECADRYEKVINQLSSPKQ